MTQNFCERVIKALDPKRLLCQLQELGEIGHDSSGGRTRLALTDADKEGRDQVVAWMRELDMSVTVDSIGNIFGVYAGQSVSPGIMMGSHIDTVANAGAYDGVYGVLAGLAVVRAFKTADVKPALPLVVAVFTNEEGARFQPDMLGSLVYVGGLPLDEALDTISVDGVRLGDELHRIGYDGPPQAKVVPPAAYLELHVEQGPVLDHEKTDIGVVEGVQGISWQEVSVSGEANHAGTTPMNLRFDAGCTAGRIISRMREITQESDTTLATVGSISFEPNVINVIPSRATLTIDLRDPNEQTLCAAEEMVESYLNAVSVLDAVEISSRRLARFAPVPFDADMISTVELCAHARGYTCHRMVSGAGHDAQMMARICPVGMIFVPSKDGLSHSPGEDTDAASLERGLRVLLDVVVTRLGI